MLYRAGEKKILHYLIDCSDKISALFSMPLKEARKEVNKNSGKEYEGMTEYIKNNVYPALMTKEAEKK